MHLLLLTDEKCQLSCFYFGVFALFIWFISAWSLLALTAARPVLPAPEFFRLIWFGAPRRWARWLTCSLTPGAQQLPSLVFQRSPPRTTLACCLSAGLRLPVHGGERHTRLHTHMRTQKRGGGNAHTDTKAKGNILKQNLNHQHISALTQIHTRHVKTATPAQKHTYIDRCSQYHNNRNEKQLKKTNTYGHPDRKTKTDSFLIPTWIQPDHPGLLQYLFNGWTS